MSRTATLAKFSAKLVAVTGLIFCASSSFASRNDLINDALNKNLEERDQVTGTYKQNDAAERPVVIENRAKSERIPVVMESELSAGTRPLRDYDSASRTYQESHVEAHLDREVKDIDHAYEKQQTHDSSKSAVRALLDTEG
jgi:hypothetical protein